jgi:TonB-dependent receptor
VSIKIRPKTKRSRLACTISAALAATTLCGADQVLAQDNSALEEVVVTGIRGSLQRSMDIKREAIGVVDAISAEDMGKFPDTNLAESLQRITGVSIDRRNGEGANITVRGFGPANNMVTLNGRAMPSGGVYGGSGAGGTVNGVSRAFDFSNLAAESVSGVEVYKTGRASIGTGGIGATVNIKTLKPLEDPGLNASIGLKAMHDTTNRGGDDWTPELSGLLSWTDDAEKFGVGLTFSYQERDSGHAGAHANGWNIMEWDATEDWTDGNFNRFGLYPGAATLADRFTNMPADGQLFGRSNDFRWAFSDIERERTNAQLILQMQASDSVRLSLDYTYAELDVWEHRGEWTMWFNNNSSITGVTFDNSPVATPIRVSEITAEKDIGYEQQLRQQLNTLKSIGFNVDWNVNDTLNLSFDMHSSSLDSEPNGHNDASSIDISIGAPIISSWVLTFDDELPNGTFTVDDTMYGNGNGIFDEADLGSAQGRIWYTSQMTDIDQFKFDGVQELENGHLDFGLEARSLEMRQQSSNNGTALGDWNVTTAAGEFAPGTFEMFDLAGQFEDYDTSGMFPYAPRAYDVLDLCRQVEAIYSVAQQWSCTPDLNFSSDNKIEEDILALYAEFGLEAELAGLPVNIVAGFRYERTELTSTSFLRLPQYLVWQDNNDFQETIYANEVTPFSIDNDYNHLLPNFDFDISFRDDLKGRFSFSKTIARANFGSLFLGAGNFGQNDPTLAIGATPTATANNPRLVPLESNNFDLSLEWYYGEANYLSVGLFEKRVDNFIGNGQEMLEHYGMQDVSNGPRAEAALAELNARGITVDSTSLFVMTVIMDNPGPDTIGNFPGGITLADWVDDGTTVDAAFAGAVAASYDIHAEAGDPAAVWQTSVPVNNKEAKINGMEIAVQHFFGETGFGIGANYTVVNGDIGFNNLADPNVDQFALLGLSDTANIVFIYENHGWEARLAYNWRDEFLQATNVGPGRNPNYVDEYSQIDLNVSYAITDNFTVLFEGINLTEENTRHHGRTNNMTKYVEDLGARYNIGARYKF